MADFIRSVYSARSQLKEEAMADNGPTIIELDRQRMTAMAEKNIDFLTRHLC